MIFSNVLLSMEEIVFFNILLFFFLLFIFVRFSLSISSINFEFTGRMQFMYS